MSNYIPQDGFDTFLSQPLSSGDTVAYVNAIPSTVTTGYLTVFELDGVTIRCKIKFTGVGSSPARLTGVTFIGLVPVGSTVVDTAVTGTDCPKNSRIALTDNIHYLGRAISQLNGDTEMGGVMQLPAARTINSSRDIVDKEYADALTVSALPQFLVTQNGLATALQVNIGAGRYTKPDATQANYAGASAVAVLAGNTNYIEMDTAGTVTVNQTAFTAGRMALAEVVCDGTGITGITDRRSLMGMNDGTVDKVRTWGTVQSLTADNLQVTTAANSDNDALNRKYLDDNAVKLNNANFVDLTDTGATTLHFHEGVGGLSQDLLSYSYPIPLDVDQVGNTNGVLTATCQAVSWFQSSNANYALVTYLPGINGSATNLNFSTAKRIRIQWRSRITGVAGDKFFGLGQNFSAMFALFDAHDNRIGFASDGGTLYAANANGVAETKTDISVGLTLTDWHTFMIDWQPGTNARFYVDGVLLATHTTNLPNINSEAMFGFGGETNGEDVFIAGITANQLL